MVQRNEIGHKISRDSKREILGVAMPDLSRTAALAMLEAELDRDASDASCRAVAFANANLLYQAGHQDILRQALTGFLVLNDGIGADIASRILFGRRFTDNLNGTDFIPHFLGKTRRPLRLFLLGARPGIAERAGEQIRAAHPRHVIAGTAHGYFRESEAQDLIARIRASKADVLLVAMGNPRQELWLSQHLAATGCRLGFGVGALFDFLSGDVARAPALLRRLRLEWAYRLMQEPRRLFRRYCVDTPSFLGSVMQQRLRRRARI